MVKKQKTAITPTRNENYSEWYQNVIKASELAENSTTRGCMVIKPWGYSLWENITNILNNMFKNVGIKNAYFPLLIPLSFMEKEAEHVEGFAKECAVVTHNKLKQDESGKLIPEGMLSEPLIIRPTSETIIGDSFSRWIKSYRDLPLLINQWANVVRWEMRTRMFLRTSEFLWQEGHTAHSTSKEAKERTLIMLDIYEDLAEKYLGIPVIKGVKSERERFPGAIDTLCIEAMMQDRKALQVGTSHFLGQNFAKSSSITFQTQNSKEEFVWTTSWGVSTRLIGGIIMIHGDDNGIVLPPRIAPSHIVFLPIFKTTEEKQEVMDFVNILSKKLNNIYYHDRKIVTEIDIRNIGAKRKWEWIKKGIPLIIEVGLRDIKKKIIYLFERRNKNKLEINVDEFVINITTILDGIQKEMFTSANKFREDNTVKIDSLKEFINFFTPNNKKKPEIHGGFALSHWCGRKECESKIKDDLSVTIRCIPSNQNKSDGYCICCNKRSKSRVLFSKAY